MNSEFVRLSHVKVHFGKTKALNDVNISFPSRGFFGLYGQSGSGKSTFLNVVAGLCKPTSGMAMVLEREIGRLSEEEARAFRLGRIGFLDQQVSLLDSDTVLSNVLFPMESYYGDERRMKRKRALDLLSLVGCLHLKDKRPRDCSGGERQRIGLAVALATSPSIVLADEPSSALDFESAKMIFEALRQVSRSALVIVVSHDYGLLSSYCDVIYSMKDGAIGERKELREFCLEGKIPALRLRERKRKNNLPFLFLLRHAYHILSGKRFRFLLFLSSLVVSFLGVGAGSYLSDAIENEVSGALSSLLPSSELVMSRKGGGDGGSETLFAISQTNLLRLERAMGEGILGSGESLLFDFESLFSDQDDFALLYGAKRVDLPYFRARSINDFLWLDEREREVFPHRPLAMDDDDVVIGLPFDEMASLCYSLGIQRDFESLGSVCDGSLRLSISLVNQSIGFETDELLNVVGFIQAPSPCLLHLNHRWNRYFYVEHLNFHPSVSSDLDNPQTVFALPYVCFPSSPEEFLLLARQKGIDEFVAFDFYLPTYLPTLYGAAEENWTGRAYLLSYPNSSIEKEAVYSVLQEEAIRGYQFCSPLSYLASTDSIAFGFSFAFYLSPVFDDVVLAGETAAKLSPGLPLSSISLPSSVRDLNYLSSSRGGAKFLTLDNGDLSSIDPQKAFGLYVSESLFESWGKPQQVYLAFESYTDPNSEFREIGYCELPILGALRHPGEAVFGRSGWIEDFFSVHALAPSYLYSPSSALLSFDGVDGDELATMLRRKYPEYDFVNPTSLFDTSFGGATTYVSFVLLLFSLLCLLLSFALFAYAFSLFRIELSNESRLFRLLGFSLSDERRSLFAISFLVNLFAFLSSCLGLTGVMVFAHLLITSSFGVVSSFVLEWAPFALLLLLSLLFSFVSLLLSRIAVKQGGDK